MWEDFHVIQVTVDRVQVLYDRKSHISFISEQYVSKKVSIHNIRKTVRLKLWQIAPVIPHNVHHVCTPSENMLSAYGLLKKKKKGFKRWAHCMVYGMCQQWLSLSGCTKHCLSNWLHCNQPGSETSTDRSTHNLKIVLYQNQLSKH